MSTISGVSSQSDSLALQKLLQTAADKAVQTTVGSGATSSALTALQSDLAEGSSATDGVSGTAAFLQDLSRLQATDPAKYKAFTSNLAAALKTVSEQGGSVGTALSSLADSFAQASASGDVSSILTSASTGGASAVSAYSFNAQSYKNETTLGLLDALTGGSGSSTSSIYDILSKQNAAAAAKFASIVSGSGTSSTDTDSLSSLLSGAADSTDSEGTSDSDSLYSLFTSGLTAQVAAIQAKLQASQAAQTGSTDKTA